MRIKILKSFGCAYVMFTALLIGWLIFTKIIQPGGLNNEWDQYVHALHGLNIAHDFQQGDWLNLLFDTYRQVYYPPVHPWLIGMAFIMKGPSMITARTVSLVLFVLMAPLLFVAACQMREQYREVAGIVAATLLLTSPPLILHSSLCMLEITGLFAISLTLFIHGRVSKNGSRSEHMLLGLCMTLAYFIKINYGVLLVIAFGVTQLINAKFRFRMLITRSNFYTILPMVIIFSLWFAYPIKIISTWRALVSVPWGVKETYGLKGFLFYPRALIKLSGSPWLFVLFLASMIVAFKFRTEKNIRFLMVLIFTQLIIAQLHQSKDIRHIFTILPPLFLITGYSVAEFWTYISRRKKALAFLIPLFLTGALFLHSFSVLAESWPQPLLPHNNEVVSHLAAKVRETGETLILGSIELTDPYPPVIDWKLIVQEGLMSTPQAGTMSPVGEIRKLANALQGIHAPLWLMKFFRPILSRAEQKGMTRTVYLGVYPCSIKTKADISFFFRKVIEENAIDGVVILTSLNPEARHPFSFILNGLKNTTLKPESTRIFKNTRVDVYKKQL